MKDNYDFTNNEEQTENKDCLQDGEQHKQQS